MFLFPREPLEIVVIFLVLVVLVVLLVLIIILIVVLAVSAVLVVLRIVAVVKSVIVVLIVIRHFEFLLSVDSYRSSMSKTHKKNTYIFSVLWYYFQLHFCDFSTKIKNVNRNPFINLFTTLIY